MKALFSDLDGAKSRFWAKVDRTGDCWVWTGAKGAHGYGRVTIEGKSYLATRVAWALEYGEWPNEFVLHRCDNPPCVRLAHLFAGDQKTNMQDAAAKGRIRGVFQVKKVCKYGHALQGDNVGFINSRTRGKQLRYCKVCSARRNAERKEYKHQWYLKNRILTNV